MGLTRDAIQAQLLHHLLATKRPLGYSVIEHDRRDMVLWFYGCCVPLAAEVFFFFFFLERSYDNDGEQGFVAFLLSNMCIIG